MGVEGGGGLLTLLNPTPWFESICRPGARPDGMMTGNTKSVTELVEGRFVIGGAINRLNVAPFNAATACVCLCNPGWERAVPSRSALVARPCSAP